MNTIRYPTPWQGSCEFVVQNPYPTCGQPAVASQTKARGITTQHCDSAKTFAQKPHRAPASRLHPNEPQRFQSRARGWKSVSEMFFWLAFSLRPAPVHFQESRSSDQDKRQWYSALSIFCEHLMVIHWVTRNMKTTCVKYIYIYIHIIYIYILFINTVECTEYCNHIINSTLPNMNGKC